MSESPRLCRDCRSAMLEPGKNRHAEGAWTCAHPTSHIAARPDLVTGEHPTLPAQMSCVHARASELRCGHRGVHWEPRP
jgi:hypothetical protein